MYHVPVLYIIFNRPDATASSFEIIRNIKPKKLYVAADGPRRGVQGDPIKCMQTRAQINVDWDCDLKQLFRQENRGCGKGPAEAIDWFFENEEFGIILEDDCIPNSDFFHFMESMLDMYKNNEKVFNVSGCNLGYSGNIPHTYFYSKFMNMWGWGTWRRTAKEVDYSLSFLKKEGKTRKVLYNRLKYGFFDYDYNWINFWEAKVHEIWEKRDIDFWDYHWILNQLYFEKLSIIPAVNLVKNIGFDSNATHTLSPDHPIAFRDTFQLEWPLKHPSKVSLNMEYENVFVKKKWLGAEKMPYPILAGLLMVKGIKWAANKLIKPLGFQFGKHFKLAKIK